VKDEQLVFINRKCALESSAPYGMLNKLHVNHFATSFI